MTVELEKETIQGNSGFRVLAKLLQSNKKSEISPVTHLPNYLHCLIH